MRPWLRSTKANAELADLADTAAEEAGRVLANAKRALRKARTTAAQRKLDCRPDPVAGRRRGRLARAVNDLERAAGGDPTDRSPDAAAAGRGYPGRVDPAGQPARPRRPADREGPARQAGRVRPQSPSC